MVKSRKVKLYPVGDKEEVNRVYQYIRDGMYNQNKAYNLLISEIYGAMMHRASKDEINLLYKRGKRRPKKDDPEFSLYDYDTIAFPKGLDTASTVGQKAKKYFGEKAKDLLSGNVSLENKKRNAALWIESKQFSFYHEYDSYNDFYEHLFKSDCKLYMKFVNGITFNVILGHNLKRSNEIRCVFQNIFEENYKVKGSSIQIDGKDIILNLSIDIPEKPQVELDENIVIGVDRGINTPAYCATNTSEYLRKKIGDRDDFVRVRDSLENQIKRCQRSSKYNRGGHGRKRKCGNLDRFHKREKNFVNTYSHKVSKEVVEFALKCHAKYINIEELSDNNFDDLVLRKWSYYKLEQQIRYKASMYGIEVRKVNSAYTSMTCSCCGNVDENNRPKKKVNEKIRPAEYFKCTKCGYTVNADYNAARNIARSTDFVK